MYHELDHRWSPIGSDHCWPIVKQLQWKLNDGSVIATQENIFENVFCGIATMSRHIRAVYGPLFTKKTPSYGYREFPIINVRRSEDHLSRFIMGLYMPIRVNSKQNRMVAWYFTMRQAWKLRLPRGEWISCWVVEWSIIENKSALINVVLFYLTLNNWYIKDWSNSSNPRVIKCAG